MRRFERATSILVAAFLLCGQPVLAQTNPPEPPPKPGARPATPKPVGSERGAERETVVEPGTPTELGREKTKPIIRPLSFSKAPPKSNPLLAGMAKCEGGRDFKHGVPGSQASACFPAWDSANAPSAAPGQLPAQEWEVVTSGGAGEVTITVSVPEMPQLNALFSVPDPARQVKQAPDFRPGGETKGESAPRISTPRDLKLVVPEKDSEAPFGNPAGSVRRIVRFAGMPYTASTPREIRVVLNAKDSGAYSATTDFRIYPYSPRLAEVTKTASVARSAGAVFMDLAGLGAATKLERKNVGNRYTDPDYCWWGEVDPYENGLVDIYSPIQLGSHEGTYEFSRQGVFSTLSSGAFACHFLMAIQLRFPLMEDGQKTPVIVLKSSSPLSFQARQTYHVTSTWALRNALDLFPDDGLDESINKGICSGESVGPSNHPVGMRQVDGDLSFNVRSGPIGTDCRFTDIRQNALKLPPGFEVVSSNWKKEYSSKCGLGQNGGGFDFSRGGWTVAPDGLGDVSGIAATLYDPDHAGVALRTDGVAGFRTVLRPVMVWLNCETTAVNDHYIRVWLEEATFSGPPGEDFP